MKICLLGLLLALGSVTAFAGDNTCTVVAFPDSFQAPVDVYFSCPAQKSNVQISIDYGDGTSISTTSKDVTGCTNSIPANCWTNTLIEGHHKYQATGSYQISIKSADGNNQAVSISVK